MGRKEKKESWGEPAFIGQTEEKPEPARPEKEKPQVEKMATEGLCGGQWSAVSNAVVELRNL